MKSTRTDKWSNPLLHAAFWLLLFVLPYLLQPSFEQGMQRPHVPPSSMRLFDLFHTTKFVFWIGLFYLNVYFLIPKIFYKKGKLIYSVSLAAVLILLSVIEVIYFLYAPAPARFRLEGFIKFNLFPFLFTLVCSTAYRMYLDRKEDEKKRKEKETENLKTELSFLRSQLSPHFMFNVLNNMVSLAHKKSDLLVPSLIKLSSLMRYFLYENDEEKVSLTKEIEYMQSYIDLQQQRFGKNLFLSVLISRDKDYLIAPMLLIPFVENAFKHGIGMFAEASIDIKLDAKKDKLYFEVANNYYEGRQQVKDKTSGIGLANVQRRLNLLYEKAHHLQINKNDGRFEVSLQIELC